MNYPAAFGGDGSSANGGGAPLAEAGAAAGAHWQHVAGAGPEAARRGGRQRLSAVCAGRRHDPAADSAAGGRAAPSDLGADRSAV